MPNQRGPFGFCKVQNPGMPLCRMIGHSHSEAGYILHRLSPVEPTQARLRCLATRK